MTTHAEFTRLFRAARAVVFDFDGVLADSERWHFVSYRDVFARYGHTLDETEYYKYWTSLGQGARGEIARHGLDLDPIAIRDEKRPIFSEYCRDGSIPLYREARAILDLVVPTGKTLAIASGTITPDIEAILENAGVRGLFSHIVGSDDVPVIKPAPDVFVEVLRRLGLRPDECLVIEDAEKGLVAAREVGLPVVVVRTAETRAFDFSAADVVVDSHAELLDAFREAVAAGPQPNAFG